MICSQEIQNPMSVMLPCDELDPRIILTMTAIQLNEMDGVRVHK